MEQYNDGIVLTKKLAKHAVGVGLSFPLDTFGIERMIGDKMLCSDFLGCSIDTDLPFREQNFNLWIESFFCLFKKKKNNEDTTMPLRGGNMC